MYKTLRPKTQKEKPRVVFIYPPPYPARLPLLDLICAQMDSVVLFFSKHTLVHPDWDIDLILEQVRFPYHILPGVTLPIPGEPHFRPSVLWYLWRYKPDVVVTAEFNPQTLFAVIYASLFRSKVLILSEETRHTARTRANRRWFRKWLVRRCDGFVATSSETGKYLCELDVDPNTIFVSFQIPDVLKWKRSVEKEKKSQDDIRAELGLSGKVILYVGRLEPHKGLQLLLEAFHGVIETAQNASLLVVGSGSEEVRLRQYCEQNGLSDRVMFSGYKQPDELPKYYAAADMFIFPTLWDPFGIVIAEALASGLPVICSPFAGAADLIEEGKNGYILDPRDTEKMALLLSNLLTDEDLLERLRHGALASIENFTIEKSAEQFLEALEFVMKDAP